ncbi:hypothetical protein RRG08_007943 [Elysia crispata]|uniref:Uncharacterized protein n=1 Tax=Elysia crispata TaxID=231223 RepID=A0AAE0ZQ07_9GAST|nr:hypothetical protein RRG08_007943 [Elysia crispata]
MTTFNVFPSDNKTALSHRLVAKQHFVTTPTYASLLSLERVGNIVTSGFGCHLFPETWGNHVIRLSCVQQFLREVGAPVSHSSMVELNVEIISHKLISVRLSLTCALIQILSRAGA